MKEKKRGRPRKIQKKNGNPEGWKNAKRFITLNGNTGKLSDYARAYGIPVGVLAHRLFKLKWDIEKALTEPAERVEAIGHGEKGAEYTTREVAERAGISMSQAYKRIKKGYTGKELFSPTLWKGEPPVTIVMGGEKRTFEEISEITGIPVKRLKGRYYQGQSINRITESHCVKVNCADCKAVKCRNRKKYGNSSW